jgi:hypothetical protein
VPHFQLDANPRACRGSHLSQNGQSELPLLTCGQQDASLPAAVSCLVSDRGTYTDLDISVERKLNGNAPLWQFEFVPVGWRLRGGVPFESRQTWQALIVHTCVPLPKFNVRFHLRRCM